MMTQHDFDMRAVITTIASERKWQINHDKLIWHDVPPHKGFECSCKVMFQVRGTKISLWGGNFKFQRGDYLDRSSKSPIVNGEHFIGCDLVDPDSFDELDEMLEFFEIELDRYHKEQYRKYQQQRKKRRANQRSKKREKRRR